MFDPLLAMAIVVMLLAAGLVADWHVRMHLDRADRRAEVQRQREARAEVDTAWDAFWAEAAKRAVEIEAAFVAAPPERVGWLLDEDAVLKDRLLVDAERGSALIRRASLEAAS